VHAGRDSARSNCRFQRDWGRECHRFWSKLYSAYSLQLFLYGRDLTESGGKPNRNVNIWRVERVQFEQRDFVLGADPGEYDCYGAV